LCPTFCAVWASVRRSPPIRQRSPCAAFFFNSARDETASADMRSP
jgi:hypothetical protein